MKTHLILLFLWLSHTCYSQVTDNFNDSDLTSLPPWVGQLSSFATSNGELRSNSSLANVTYSISTKSQHLKNCEWRLNTRLLFNTSSLNYIDFVIVSDSSDVLKMKNGYFVRMGGATDEISFYKTKNGIETKLIDGTDNVLNNSNNQWQLIVKHLPNGLFVLQRKMNATSALITEGVTADSDILQSNNLGIRIKQSTASFFNKHFFDNLYAGPILNDTIAPVLDSLVISGPQQLLCVFNEICDSISLKDAMHFEILNSIHPITVLILDTKRVQLIFKDNFKTNTFLSLMVTGIKDTAGNMIKPVSKTFYYSRPDTAKFHQLLITELMPDPNPVVGLPDKEYIEITNHSGGFIQLNSCVLHDPSGGKNLPNMILPPDSIIVMYAIPSLNNAGDHLWLTNQKGDIIHDINYDLTWFKDDKKKNGGWSLEMINMDNLCAGANNWGASMDKAGGTPGQPNSVGAYHLSDTAAPRLVSILPFNDSIIELVFNEEIDSINSSQFKLYKNGQVQQTSFVNMASDYKGLFCLIQFIPDSDSVYKLAIDGIKDCAGNGCRANISTLQWPSLSRRNELIINEILFNPKSGGYDFIELYNNSNKAFDLSKHFIAVLDETNQYKSIDRICNTQLILQANQYLLLSENTAKICSNYQCKNADAKLVDFAKMPALPDDEGNLLIVNMIGKIVDSLKYSEGWHFPLLSDKEGVSLERINFTSSPRLMDNWHSAASVVGFATPGYLNSQSNPLSAPAQYFSLQNKTVSPDDDGFEDVLILNYQLPKQDYATTIQIYDLEGRLVRQWINNETLGTNGFLSWNGTDYNQQKAAIGLYVLHIECTHPDGSKIREKLSCVVAGKF